MGLLNKDSHCSYMQEFPLGLLYIIFHCKSLCWDSSTTGPLPRFLYKEILIGTVVRVHHYRLTGAWSCGDALDLPNIWKHWKAQWIFKPDKKKPETICFSCAFRFPGRAKLKRPLLLSGFHQVCGRLSASPASHCGILYWNFCQCFLKKWKIENTVNFQIGFGKIENTLLIFLVLFAFSGFREKHSLKKHRYFAIF